MLIAVDEESLINSDIANRRKRIMDSQLIDKLGRRVEQQQAEINRLREVIRLARDTAYQATQDCPRCGFIDDVLTKTLNSENIKDDDK